MMKEQTSILILLCLVLLISGCTSPSEGEPTSDIVGTQVAQFFTKSALETAQAPTETLIPSATETQIQATNTPTATSTVTETPTYTQDLSDPAIQLGNPTWTQDFSGNSSPWDYESEQASFSTSGGYLNLTARVNPNWHSWYFSSPRLKNAYVEATITLTNCSGRDRFGLAVRGSSDFQQFYFLSITCDGQWGFFRMAPEVEIITLQGYQNADPLSEGTGLPHRVGIWMDGPDFTIYIDGQEMGAVSDTTLANEGFTGFLIAYANISGFTVKVDQLQYWNLP
jgi:hypothetical protein